MVFAPPQTIEDALANWGVLTDTANLMVDISNTYQRITTEMFNNTLYITKGNIRLKPATKLNIRAFI